MKLKDRIAETFLELVQKKSLDKITVRDIVDKCGVTRQSFYYYFSDIFDLIEWVMQRESESLISDISKNRTLEQRVKRFIEYIYSNRELMRRLMNTSELATIEKIKIKTARTFFKKISDPKVISDMSSAELEMTLDFYSFAIEGFMMGMYIRNDTDIDRASAYLLKLIKGETPFIKE